MAARDEQQQVGKLDAVRQACGQGMGLKVVHGHEGLSGGQGQSLAGGQTHHDAADEAGACGSGDGVEIGKVAACVGERALDQPINHLDMGAGGNFGHDAAIGGMFCDLAHDLVGEDRAAAVGLKLDDGRSGLVTGGFDSQNAHHISRRCCGCPNHPIVARQ